MHQQDHRPGPDVVDHPGDTEEAYGDHMVDDLLPKVLPQAEEGNG